MSHPRANGNRRDRRAANQKLMAPIDLWRECVQDAEGCYFDPACRAPAIDAHALSKGWLNPLADANQKVYWFAHREGLVPELRKPLIETGSSTTLDQTQRETYLDQVQRKAHPDLASVDVATTAKFCCKQCDPKFNPIDSLGNRNPPDPDNRGLSLMFHRAVIRQLYKDTVSKTYCEILGRRYSGFPFPWDDNPHWGKHDIENLQWTRDVLLFALDSAGGFPSRVQHDVQHIVLNIRGAPQVAACGAGAQGRHTWGFTVMPHAGGHLVAFHHCIGHPLPLVPVPTPEAARAAWADVIGDAAGLPPRELTPQDRVAQRISRFLLVHCKEVCLAPAAWNAWDEGKQDAIRDLFFSTITGDRFSGPPSAACPDVNLFD